MKPDHDDPLEAALQGSPVYLDDRGFTDGVMRSLPPARPGSRLRAVVLGLATAIACLLGLVVLPGGEALLSLMGAMGRALAGGPLSAPVVITGVVLLALIVWGCVATATSD
jgi:hypothetical protein